MKKIKVLHLIRLAEGGMKEHFLNLVKNLNQDRFSLFAAGPFSQDTANDLKQSGIAVYSVPMARNIQPLKDLASLIAIKRILQREKIDLIHLHGSKAALLGRLAAQIARTRSSIFTVHNFILDNYKSRSKKMLFTFIEQCLAHSTSKIITVSEALKKELMEKQQLPPEKVITIYNGIELEKFPLTLPNLNLKEKLGLPPNSIVVGTVSRLIPEKGLQYLLQSAYQIKKEAQEKEIVFLIVGEGPYRANLEKMCLTMELGDRVFFTGYRTDIQGLLGLMDVFVLPSLSEGLGVALLEAMAMGKPVIGSQVGGIPEVIEDGINGYLVPPADSLALTFSILRLISGKEQLKVVEKEARKIIEERFSLKKMVERVEKVYWETLS